MSFGSVLFTNKGRILQAKAETGVSLQFTKISIGKGSLNGSPISQLTSLIDKVMDITITSLEDSSNGYAKIGGVFNNQGLLGGFYWRELGLYANDPDEGEILYCYGNAGDLAEYIPADSGSEILERFVSIVAIIGNASNITASIDNSLVYATKQEVQDLNQQILNIEVPVTSVNAKTGDIVLSALDVGAETPEGAQSKANAAEQNSKTYTDNKVAAIVESAPATLDTLNELAQALGDDPNFATTISTQIGQKIDNSKKSDSVSSTSSDTVGTSKAVKIAYDKGVEALNKANNNSTQMAEIVQDIGDLTTLPTVDKSSLTNALTEVFTSVSSGKIDVKNAITGKGVIVLDGDGDGIPTFTELKNAINSVEVLDNLVAGEDWTGMNAQFRQTQSTSFVKMKESRVEYPGTVRISFEGYTSWGGTGYLRLYKNGVAVGIVRNPPYNTTATYTVYTEDISVNAGDLIQIYGKAASGDEVSCKNLKFGYVSPYVVATAIL